MHRSVESSQLSRTDKRLWKRIWWTLFTRDRSVAVALGRPVLINTDDSDVEMITEDDFIEDETDTFSGVPAPAEYPPDHIHVQFFLQYVKLCEIMGLVLSQQYSVAGKARWSNAIDLTHSDIALADWLQNCPREMCWDKNRHHFWSALLHSNYYTTLCLLHRAHMPPATMANAHGAGRGQSAHQGLFGPNGARIYPSKTIAFQAAAMVTSIISQLQVHDQLRFTPAFIVYSLFSALIMHVYQMRSSDPSTVAACHEKISICMQALRDVSHAWLVAKMVHTLFESILGNKAMKEKMQKAAGKRHQHFRQMQKQAGHDHQTRHNNVQKHHYHSTGVPYVPPATLQKDMMSGSNDMVDPNATEIASSAAGVPGSPPLAAPTVNSNLDAASAVATINDTTIHGVTTTSIRPSELTQIPGQAGHQAAFHRKRKHSDLDPVAYPGGGTSAPQMSYERSRPQTPVDRAMDANGDGTQSHTQHLASTQQQQQQQCGNQALHDSALGDAPEAVDYGVTRPTTPFNHPYSFSIPNTPPDLFLVTRNSPNLSQTMWENFQPDQLFPDGAMGGVSINEELNFCPSDPVPESVPPGVTIDNNVNGRAGTIHDAAVDPSLQTSAIPHTSGHIPNVPMHNAHAPTSVMPHEALPAAEDGTKPQDQKHAFSPGGYQPSPLNGTSGLGPPPNPGDRPPSDDDWSSSSRGASGGPIVPLTLNVEDWFQFFGLQGAFDTA
ncbi:Transcriptional activator of fatty acid utilization [Ascosphaera aggregata]|nr:Transcriptional activator of fatty acid utilization [Ascosphaera aggregata]